MIKRYKCKRTGKEVAAVPSKRTYAMLSEDGHFHSVLTDVFEKGYEEITDKEELRVKVTKLPHEFVKHEKVLRRNFCDRDWRVATFEKAAPEAKGFSIYECFRPINFCIPYKGNEHLEGKITNCSSGRWSEDYEFPKPEHEFKPFDRVVVRDGWGRWTIDIFSTIRHENRICKYIGMCDMWEQCLPYNEKTAKLIGTKDDWEG